VAYKTDRVVFAEGDPATHLYLVQDGSVVIQIQTDPDHRIDVFTAGKGISLGWSALVPPYRMTATCIARGQVSLIKIDGQQLRNLCDRDHQVGYRIMSYVARVIEQRLHDTRLELSNLIYWIRQ
jgi:CRP-like cAMP-binding protein